VQLSHFVSLKTVVIWSVLGLCLSAVPARAELVFFSSGRTLSVKSHRFEGASLVLTMRSGAEVFCDPSLVERIAPDEVAYPEPDNGREEGAADFDGGPDQLAPHAAAFEARYGPVVDRVAAREGVDPRLVRAVIEVESGFQVNARSPKGAMGLMQLMPATARRYAVKNPYDPVTNIDAGVRHLKSLLARFPPALALAAYNAGEAAVERFGGVPPYAETRNYVSRILRLVGTL
jgi:soluble lytic murein transglycosylase-like protein